MVWPCLSQHYRIISVAHEQVLAIIIFIYFPYSLRLLAIGPGSRKSG